MLYKGFTVKDATYHLIRGFNAIPQSIMSRYDPDRVSVWNGDEGEVMSYDPDNETYMIQIDGEDEESEYDESEVWGVEYLDYLPMWSTMWTFGDHYDEEWALSHLHEMANMGFRIYRTPDFDCIFGIDGAGYDFYEAHWIPLYRALGYQWHDPETETKEVC